MERKKEGRKREEGRCKRARRSGKLRLETSREAVGIKDSLEEDQAGMFSKDGKRAEEEKKKAPSRGGREGKDGNSIKRGRSSGSVSEDGCSRRVATSCEVTFDEHSITRNGKENGSRGSGGVFRGREKNM